MSICAMRAQHVSVTKWPVTMVSQRCWTLSATLIRLTADHLAAATLMDQCIDTWWQTQNGNKLQRYYRIY